MAYTLSNNKLEEALEELCTKLVEKGAMRKEDKPDAIKMVQDALNIAYDGNVPQDLFTDPVKRKNLLFSLISAPLMKTNPDLQFDLALFFKAKLEPEKVKTLFKTFLTELNKLEPDPNKRRSEKEIDAEAEALLDKIEQENKKKQEAGESSRLVDNKSACDALEEIFQTLFAITRFGAAVTLSVNKGNTAGYINTGYTGATYSSGGGSMGDSRAFSDDSTIDPYVTAMAQERLLDLGGLGAAALETLEKKGIFYNSPSNTRTK